MNVSDAAAQADGTVVTVTGYLFDDTGTVVISDLIAESYPPQPGGPTLEIDQLDLTIFDGVTTEGPISWTEQPATITATVEGGRLTGAAKADG